MAYRSRELRSISSIVSILRALVSTTVGTERRQHEIRTVAGTGKIPRPLHAHLAPETGSNARIARTRAKLVVNREGLQCPEVRLVQLCSRCEPCSIFAVGTRSTIAVGRAKGTPGGCGSY